MPEAGEASVSLYQRIMKDRFDALPEAVRMIHTIHGHATASGKARVQQGDNIIARFAAWVMRFPPGGEHELRVAFAERDGIESWTRSFSGHNFTSHLSESRGRLVERFGPLRFHFDLPSDKRGLEMRLKRWSLLGVPLPMAFAPRSLAREWQEGERFRFDVPISLPLIGLVVHYDGWLLPEAERRDLSPSHK